VSEDIAEAIGLADMLAPLPGESPVGVDLRQDFSASSPYYRLRDARSDARAAERAADGGSGDPAAALADWRSVRQIACAALKDKTRDLEIAAWLTEALVRGEGVPGLIAGARLMDGLVNGFWECGLLPSPDEDGIATRVAPVTGLNGEGGDGTLIQPLRKQTILNRPDGSPVAYWEYDASAALQLETDAKKKQARIAAGVLSFEDMETAARAMGSGYFAALRRDIKQALQSWSALSASLDRVAGQDSPPTGRVRQMLQDMLDVATRYAPPEAEDAPPEDAAPETAGDAQVATVSHGTVKTPTREDMLRDLVRIADFFRRTEPHSPLAYTLEEAVRRGRMTWPELLAEIVPDASARAQMLIQLGIKPPA
jgi:type VI secretion system protein ImpA